MNELKIMEYIFLTRSFLNEQYSQQDEDPFGGNKGPFKLIFLTVVIQVYW